MNNTQTAKNERICYLCSEIIKPNDIQDKDHVISKQFIKRKQPITKDFDYGSFLPTHKRCNRKFGDSGSNAEAICHKALKIINLIQNPEKSLKRVHRNNPDFRILAINENDLKDFSKKDLEYFGFIDVRTHKYREFTDINFFKNEDKINPMLKPMNTALSVIVKNSVALLVKRHDVAPNSFWRILVKPCFIHSESINIDFLFKGIKPFEKGLNILIKPYKDKDWFIAFQYHHTIVFIFVSTKGEMSTFEEVCNAFFNRDESFYFRSQKLVDLINYNWIDSRVDSINVE